MADTPRIFDQTLARPERKSINLALQGGGSHGAFTWGVLDRLLEDERLVIEGVSGTSAGAMNAAVLAYGMMEGGREGAREMLSRFWGAISDGARFSLFQPSWLDRMIAPGNLDFSPWFQTFDFMTRLWSPYDLNPLELHPIRDVLGAMVDFDKLRAHRGVKLFISTTNVRSGKIRVFTHDELTIDVLLASACLPLLFRAVEIEGEPYWDGGYMGNPAIFPLVYECESPDVVLVEINPLGCLETPHNSREILNRMHDISFNATLMREMRSIAFVTRLIDEHYLNDRTDFRRVLFHMIDAEPKLRRLGASSRFNCDSAFLEMLRDLGRETAGVWLARTFDRIGSESSIDIHDMFL
jgi:NTE family protein